MSPGWFIADFDGPCEWGDWINPGDTVGFVEETDGVELPIGAEHKNCREAEGPVRSVVATPQGWAWLTRTPKEGKDA